MSYSFVWFVGETDPLLTVFVTDGLTARLVLGTISREPIPSKTCQYPAAVLTSTLRIASSIRISGTGRNPKVSNA